MFEVGGPKSQWERFANEVSLLNYRAPSNVQYKVLFIGRHGDGIHNDAESYFGTPAWNVSTQNQLFSIASYLQYFLCLSSHLRIKTFLT